MCLHLLRSTWYSTSQQNIVLMRKYLLRIFQIFTAHASFTNTIVISGKLPFPCITGLFAFVKYNRNHLEHERRIERLLTLLQGLMLFYEHQHILHPSPSLTLPIIHAS